MTKYGSTAQDEEDSPLLISRDDSLIHQERASISFPKWTVGILITFLALCGVFLVASNANTSFEVKTTFLDETAPTSSGVVLSAADYDGGDYYMTLLVPTGSSSTDYDLVGEMNAPLDVRVEFLDSNTSHILDYTDIYSIKYTLEDKSYDTNLEDMSTTLNMPNTAGEYTGKINLFARSDTSSVPLSLFESNFSVLVSLMYKL